MLFFAKCYEKDLDQDLLLLGIFYEGMDTNEIGKHC